MLLRDIDGHVVKVRGGHAVDASSIPMKELFLICFGDICSLNKSYFLTFGFIPPTIYDLCVKVGEKFLKAA